MLLDMIGPTIQRMLLRVVHLLGARKLDRRDSLSTTQPIEPGTPELRLIEQPVNVGAPDQPIIPHGSVQFLPRR